MSGDISLNIRARLGFSAYLGCAPVAERELGATFVYFIEAGDDGPIKIGIATEPSKRLADLQRSHFWTLRILAVVPGDRRLERSLHRRFAGGRIRGEWFERDTPGLLEAIALVQESSERFVETGRWMA